jgi:uncharacterized membrane protein
MPDIPVEVIVAAFQDQDAAEAALKELKEAKKEHLIKIQDAAVLRMDEKGKVHIKEVHDVGGAKGAVAGGLLGAGIALLGGPAGLILAGATGALVGGLAAKKLDFGLDNERLKKLGSSLKPGSSAIVAIIEHTWVEELEMALAEAGADVMTEALSADIAAQLEAGREVVTNIVLTDEGTEVSRMTGDETSVEFQDIVMTDEGVSAQAAVATESGFAMREFALTDNAFLFDEAVVTDEGFFADAYIETDEGFMGGVIEGEFEEEEEE